jgi:small subunit ribosomal protein S20
MPNIKGAFKRMKQSRERRERNRAVKSSTKTSRRRLLEAVGASDKEGSAERLKKYYSLLDKAVKQGILKPNTASRYKSRAAKKVVAL